MPEKPNEILQIPAIVTGFTWKKMAQEWDITFTVQQENLEYAQPLQDEMGNHFIVCFVRVDSKEQAETVLRQGLDSITINP